ncbi:D-alanyl-D-alanine carboxypeptidase [Hymenobacter sp. BT175]|uniref:D-alanyl-D-alanine carboxypeptidase/D-alanyl-D-alanine-endopeptidase n=1 Tax=Hymenobacter translucens TaxID=2886507 RepID=UPI001D0EAEB4|nr:D-alanyl-D-alanine carboxypeptidase [Hymenobacter translucens]MCC2547127.1 D-alanyl-D-alanine carboxypeptidase [Hymenobacter translucens]
MLRRLFLTLLLLSASLSSALADGGRSPAAETPSRRSKGPRWLRKLVTRSPVLSRHHVGLCITDVASGQPVYAYQAGQYFIPASNMKLFSFYAGLRLLGDSLPSLRYVVRHDSLLFWGTGDPTLLHGDVPSRRAFEFLQRRPEKLFYTTIPCVEPFGPGWNWDDYNYYYQPERGPFPIYGNVVRFAAKAGEARPRMVPRSFAAQLEPAPATLRTDDHVRRAPLENRFYLLPFTKSWIDETPFRTSPELLLSLLRDTLRRPLGMVPWKLRPRDSIRTLAGLPVDSLYRRVLQVSDNFLAEQLLLMCSARLSRDSLSTERVIRTVRGRYLKDLPDAPVWVDGSGLSHQNLVTPRMLVALLLKLHKEVPEQRLLSLLAAGGGHGTLRRVYRDPAGPWLWGKTGTLSHVHNVCGYLRSRKGRLLAFSFMNNNHTLETGEVRKEMERILTQVRERL